MVDILFLSPYIIFVECIIISFLLVGSFCSFLQLLYFHWSGKFVYFDITTSMVVFMCSEIVLDIAAFVYVGYLAIWWRGQSATYDAYWMFWTGFPDSVILILAPISVVFLGLDRCVSILTLNNHQKARSIIMTCATFLAMSIDLTVATILHVIPSWPTKSETTCRSFGCLGPNSAGQTYTTCRYVTSIANVIIGICLFKLVKWKVTNKAAFNKVCLQIF